MHIHYTHIHIHIHIHIPLQNLGPVWKVFAFTSMNVDIPVAGVNSILKAQAEWEKDCTERSTKEKLHRRCDNILKLKLKN